MSDEGNISTASMIEQLRSLERAVGSERYSAALGELSASDRSTIDAMTAVGWVPISLSTEVIALAAKHAGRDAGELRDHVVSEAIEVNYKTVWRVIVKFVSDAMLVSRAGIMVHRVFDRGEVHAQMVSDGRAEMTVTQWPAIPDRALQGMRVAIKKVLELSGRHDVVVVARRTVDGAHYRMSWRV